MNAIEAKRAVRDLLGGYEPSEAAWLLAIREGSWDQARAVYADEDVSRAVDYFRRTVQLPERLGLPGDWCDRSRAMFDRFEADAQDARHLLGQAEPVPWEDLEVLLQSVADDEAQDGDRDGLTYAVPGDRWARAILIRRGTNEERIMQALAADAATLRLELAQTNRLWRVWTSARRIANTIGCEPAAALTFLLCGVVPLLPWVSVWSHRTKSDTAGALVRFTIKVGSPEVPAADVAAAYRAAVGKENAFRDALLLDWYLARKPRGSGAWSAFFGEWNAAHPQWNYKTAESLRVRCMQIAKRRQGETGGGES